MFNIPNNDMCVVYRSDGTFKKQLKRYTALQIYNFE